MDERLSAALDRLRLILADQRSFSTYESLILSRAVAILGSGPSLRTLCADDLVGYDVVIALNSASRHLHRLDEHVRTVIGCQFDLGYASGAQSICESVLAVEAETLTWCSTRSAYWFRDSVRLIQPWDLPLLVTGSAPRAVLNALCLGASSITMLACDAVCGRLDHEDGRGGNGCYIAQMNEVCWLRQAGIPIRWRHPHGEPQGERRPAWTWNLGQ